MFLPPAESDSRRRHQGGLVAYFEEVESALAMLEKLDQQAAALLLGL